MLSLGTRNNVMQAPKPMNVSKNPRVFEVDQRRIHHKARKMGGVKEIEVSVFDSAAIEIWRWVSFRL